jgi:hypothetical protein
LLKRTRQRKYFRFQSHHRVVEQGTAWRDAAETGSLACDQRHGHRHIVDPVIQFDEGTASLTPEAQKIFGARYDAPGFRGCRSAYECFERRHPYRKQDISVNLERAKGI